MIEALRLSMLRLGGAGAASLVGLVSAFVIATLFAGLVRVELDYDRALDPERRVFLIGTRVAVPGQPEITAPGATVDLAASLKARLPDVVLARLALEGTDVLLTIDGQTRSEKVHAADAELASVLSFVALTGDAAAALAVPDGLVLTQSAARRLFGSSDVLGRAVGIGGNRLFRVRAVIRDFPQNTQLSAHSIFLAAAGSNVLAPASSGAAPLMVVGSAQTYAQVAPGSAASIADAGRRLEQAANQHMEAAQQRFLSANAGAAQLKVQLHHQAVALRDLHWIDGFKLGDEQVNRGNPGRLRALAGLAALALIVAMLNFVNLAITQLTRRAREIALEKAFGASRQRIALSALAENIGIVVLSGLLAYAVAVLLQDWFSSFVDRPIDLEPRALAITAIVVAAAIVGLLAGSYPALVLSKIVPATVLSARAASAPGVGLLRTTLVILQVTASVFASGLAVVIALQLDHVTRRTLGFNPDGLLLYALPEVLETRLRTTVRELRALPGVAHVATAGATIAAGRFGSTTLFRDGGEPQDLRTFRVSPGYFETVGLTPLAGRVFQTQDEPADGNTNTDTAAALPQPLVLTETAAKRLGFASATASIGKQLRLGLQKAEVGIVIGVVPDFPVNDVRDPAARVAVFRAGTDGGDTLMLRLSPGADPGAVETVERRLAALSGKTPGRIVLALRIDAAFRDLSRLLALVSLMAVVSVVAATLGLIGLSIVAVQRMRREVAIRKVHGADVADIAALMLARLGWPLAAGLLAGYLVAWVGANRFLSSFADRTPDALLGISLAAAGLIGLSFAVIAGGVWTLARTQPATALRYE